MKRHDEIREEAARLLAEAVEPAAHGPGHPLAVAAHHVGGEPVSYDEARTRPFMPFAVGDAWGPTWDTTWFRLSGRVPESWHGEEVVLRLEHAHRDNGTGVYRDDIAHGGESLVWQDGVPRWGMSPPHRAVVILNRAEGGEPVELMVEAAANPALPERMSGIDWPRLLADYGGEPCFTLARAELAVRHRGVYALAADLRVVLGLAARSLDPVVSDAAHEALAAAAAVLDPSDVAGTAGFAREQLKSVLGRPAGPSAPRVSAVGHAHIDTAWLWPLRETVRKCARTFATAVTLMEDYPEYHFVCSAAQHLAWMEEHYPALFARIGERVATGQFGPVGGMWVESDCNVPSGESLVRQIVLGKRYFQSRFGIDCGELWLPDAFGYTASLPQIMAAAGVEWFVSQKLSWNDTNPFPHHTFWWEGIDGTRVRAHFPTADTYNGAMSPREVIRSARAERSLYPFGYGDGGGGPTREMLEAARRLVDTAGAPRVAVESTASFFAAVEADPAPLPTWRGDLYLEKHRGTFTSQAGIKAGNRRAEAALAAAELWSAVRTAISGDTPDPGGSPWPAEELEEAWKVLLTNQFHDILPGSGIRWVAEQAVSELADVRRRADALSADALDALAGAVDTTGLMAPVVVFNPTPFARREVVEHEGHAFLVDVPALGYAAVEAAPRARARSPQIAAISRPEIGAGPGWLANEHLQLRFDGAGRLVSVYDKDHGREVLAAGRAGNEFHLHEDRPRDWDAWDVDREYLDQFRVLDEPAECEVLGDGRLRFRRRFGASGDTPGPGASGDTPGPGASGDTPGPGASSIDQTVVLAPASRRIDFITEVDWHEDHKFLKVAFPVAIAAAEATFEIQFGHLRRPTTADTDFDRARFEVCAQRWADLSEPGAGGYGAALLNDAKYGYDVRGNVLRLSLLRAPTAPDPLCDRGRHRFTYALLPHAGNLAEVVAAGYALNAPLVLRPVAGGRPGPLPPSRSFVTVDDPAFVVETVKRADDGRGFIVRGYEALGAGRTVRLEAALPVTRVTRTDLLERDHPAGALPVDGHGGVTLTLRPFELVTLRLM